MIFISRWSLCPNEYKLAWLQAKVFHHNEKDCNPLYSLSYPQRKLIVPMYCIAGILHTSKLSYCFFCPWQQRLYFNNIFPIILQKNEALQHVSNTVIQIIFQRKRTYCILISCFIYMWQITRLWNKILKILRRKCAFSVTLSATARQPNLKTLKKVSNGK